MSYKVASFLKTRETNPSLLTKAFPAKSRLGRRSELFGQRVDALSQWKRLATASPTSPSTISSSPTPTGQIFLEEQLNKSQALNRRNPWIYLVGSASTTRDRLTKATIINSNSPSVVGEHQSSLRWPLTYMALDCLTSHG